MNRRVKFRSTLALTIISVLTLSSPISAVQKKDKQKAPPRGTPVLWRAHADPSALDLFNGPGGTAMRPDLRRVTFLKVETGGFSTKYRVKDGAGREWVAKIGNEAQSETAAVRLLWAAGFQTEINYLAPCVHIEGAPSPPKGAGRCEGGGFANVRFEARPDSWDRLDEWKWDDKQNPFYGTKELQGLIVLNALLNNWDLKSSNNKVIYVPTSRGGELRYIISDLGATFGKTGSLPVVWRFTRSRNKPEDFAGGQLVDEVKGRNVFLNYGGKNQTLFDDIYVEEARWVGGLLSRLSDRQLADAFRAANYAPDEVRLLAGAVRARAAELVNLSTPSVVGRKQ